MCNCALVVNLPSSTVPDNATGAEHTMIIEINYLTIVIIAGVLSAVAGVLWGIGRTFLQQYGSMLADQLAAHRAGEQRAVADLGTRLDRMEAAHAAQLKAIDEELDDLKAAGGRALTHADLEDLYSKVNGTSNSVHEMKGMLSNLNDNLRLILNQITQKGLS